MTIPVWAATHEVLKSPEVHCVVGAESSQASWEIPRSCGFSATVTTEVSLRPPSCMKSGATSASAPGEFPPSFLTGFDVKVPLGSQ
jgi:hypothetical protein